jgi:hypothetical protein
MGWPAVCSDVEGTPCHHRCHRRGAESGGDSPPVRGLPGLDQPAAGPVPGRGRGGVRAAVAAAEGLTERDRTGHRGPNRAASEGAVRAGPGRRAADHRLAPGALPRHHGVGGDRQPVPDPGRAGHPRPVQAAGIVLHQIPGRHAQRVLAIGLHPLGFSRWQRRRDPQLARRPLPIPAVLQRLSARGRPRRRSQLHRHRHHLRAAGVHPD